MKWITKPAADRVCGIRWSKRTESGFCRKTEEEQFYQISNMTAKNSGDEEFKKAYGLSYTLYGGAMAYNKTHSFEQSGLDDLVQFVQYCVFFR